MKNKTFFFFKIGRGGRFNNPGSRKFNYMIDERAISSLTLGVDTFLRLEDEDYMPIEPILIDGNGNEIMTEQSYYEALKKGELIWDIDGEYNTLEFVTAENLSESQIDAFMATYNVRGCYNHIYDDEIKSIIEHHSEYMHNEWADLFCSDEDE